MRYPSNPAISDNPEPGLLQVRRTLPTPRVDQDSAVVLDEAIQALSRLRTPYWLGDAGVRLHVLASLIAQADRVLPQAIHEARDQGLTWTEIAQLLNVSTTTASRLHRQRPQTP